MTDPSKWIKTGGSATSAPPAGMDFATSEMASSARVMCWGRRAICCGITEALYGGGEGPAGGEGETMR